MMSLEVILAGVLLVALTFYVLTGGADFGAGFWSLLARGRRKEAQRQLIAHAIGPIWEANHVWLILVITVLFTAFPKAFAVISTALHIPLTVMLVGIVLRGSAFAFRTHDVAPRAAQPSVWEHVFAVSSLLTPLFLGLTIGAIASGFLVVRDGTFLETFVAPWTAPFPLAVGCFALAIFAFLAAVYLILDATDPALQEDFRRRALLSALVVAVLAVVVFGLAADGAPQIHRDLTQSLWRWPLFLTTGVLAAGAVFALWTEQFRLARVCAVGQVSLILWGWAWAQFPYLVEPDLSIFDAAAPPVTLQWLLGALLLGAVLLFPSLYYLFRVFQRL